MVDQKKVKKVMKRLAEGHRDPRTGEMNFTGLAEEACQEMNAYIGDNIPEEFFELATQFE